MRLLRPTLAFGLILLVAQCYTANGYFFADDSKGTTSDDLATLESTPGVAIVYPRAIGPEGSEVEGNDIKDVKSEESAATTTQAPTTTEGSISEAVTTTQAPTTTTEASATTTVVSESTSSESSSTTTVAPLPSTAATIEATANLPFGVRASASASTGNGNVNRLWHFNSQGLNTNSVWFSPASRASSTQGSSLDSEAVESSQSPVRVQPDTAASTTTSSSASPVFFRRQPILADDNDELEGSNSLTKRIGAPSTRVTYGEYRNRESERNLYYPDIARIQTNGAVIQASSSSNSASSSASNSNHASHSHSVNFGVKGGAENTQNLWQKTERLTSPAKSVRKVVKSGAQRLSEEKTQFAREPVRVRVVVQKPSQAQYSGGVKAEFQNNYLERLQEASKTSNQVAQAQAQARADAAASASASSSQSFFNIGAKTAKTQSSKFNEQYATKSAAAVDSEKEFVEVSSKIVETQGVKSPPRPAAPIKSLPPPPRPAPPTKSYPTKTAVKAPIRKPVFEQQQYERYEEPEQPEPEPYSYNWQFGDDTGNGQFRREEQNANGVVRGSYGYTDAWGLYRIVDYVADANGFRASIRTNEPGLVERNPITNEVDNPANIKVSAEDTPQKVVELMRLTKPKPTTYQ